MDEQNGRWVTINGAHVFVKDGQGPMDAFIRQKGKDKKEKYETLNEKLENDLNNLDYEDLKKLYEKQNDPEIRSKLMDEMQKKDVVKYGREIYGIEMNDIDYKGSFEDAVKKAKDMNKNKDYIEEKVYHGTNADFDKFSYEKFGQKDKGDFGQGIYLTKDENVAKRYGKNLKEVEIKYKNPLILNNKQDFEKHFEYYGDKYGEAKSLYSSQQISASIMNQGYDAVIDNVYGQVVVYDLDNIKIKK